VEIKAYNDDGGGGEGGRLPGWWSSGD